MKHDTLGYLLALGIPALFVLALLLGGIPAARVVGWCVLGAAGLFYIYTVPPLGGFALAMGAAWRGETTRASPSSSFSPSGFRCVGVVA